MFNGPANFFRLNQHVKLVQVFFVFLVSSVLFSVAPTQQISFAKKGEESQYFPETNLSVSGKFLDYWQSNGGLAGFGLPITAAQPEVDPETGKTFLTQWFERSRFELHPENAGTPYEVLLGTLGKDLRREALVADPDYQPVAALPPAPNFPADSQVYFGETGHNLHLGFLDYWRRNGGLARFGFPISEEVVEVDPETGLPFVMQWFERARLEYHPENPKPYDILAGLLGKQIKTTKAKPFEYIHRFNPSTGIPSPYSILGRQIEVDGQGNFYTFEETRIYKYDSNGRLILTVGAYGRGDGQFDNVRGLTVDKDENIYVADLFNNRIQKFDRAGRFLTRWGSEGTADGQFKGPTTLAVDSQGNIVVADNVNDRIQIFDPQGHFLRKWATPYYIDDFGIDAQDNLYLLNEDTVYKYSIAGKVLKKWSVKRAPSSQFTERSNLGVDSAGHVFVVNGASHQFLKYDSEGNLLKEWGSEGQNDGQISRGPSLAVDISGNVYLVDVLYFASDPREIYRLQKFSSDGQFLGSYSPQLEKTDPSPFRNPGSLATDTNGNLFVLDSGHNRVQKFDSQGRFLTGWGSRGGGDGQFNLSVLAYNSGVEANDGITVDSNGNVYVADSGNGRIQKFDNNGKFLLKWQVTGLNKDDFGGMSGLALDRQGNILLADPNKNRIQKFDSSGNLIEEVNLKGESIGRFTKINSLAADKEGIIYAVDSSFPIDYNNGGNRILKLDNRGNVILTWGTLGSGDGQFKNPTGIAVDANGDVYVTDTANQRVQKFDNNGNFLGKWGTWGSGNGQFFDPNGITIDSQGFIYVTNTRDNQVQKFYP